MKKSTKQFVEEMHAKNNSITITGEYLGSHVKVECKCNLCGNIWSTTPSHLLRGESCPVCSRKRAGRLLSMTHDDFLTKLRSKNNKVEPLENYAGADNKILCKCKQCGYEWKISPSNLYAGKGCPKCGGSLKKTYNDFIKELKNKNENVIIVGKYVNAKTKIACVCKVCGYEWSTEPSSLLSGYGCPKCGGSLKKTHLEFQKELYILNPSIVLLNKYVNSKTKVRCKCKKCDYIWEASPPALLTGTGCPRCAGTLKKTHKDFIDELKRINDEVEVLGKYSRADIKIDFRCKKCGFIWNQTPHVLLSGHGCPKCAGNLKKTHDDFVNEVKKINESVLIVGQYNGANIPVRTKCCICGNIWEPIPTVLLRGGGCPKCNHISTSFTEQFIYESLKKRFNIVKNRDKKEVNLELDVYVPEINFAVEFGSWFWHKDKIENDINKIKVCKKSGIDLLIIYDAVPIEEEIYANKQFWCYALDLGTEKNRLTLKKLINRLFDYLEIKDYLNDKEWSEIEKKAYKQSRQKTNDEFLNELKKVNSDIVIISEYNGASKSINCMCKKCGHEWTSTPSILLSGTGCIICGGKFKKTNEEFIKELRLINKDIEPLEEYINSKTKILCRCKKCRHEWSATPSHLLTGRGCPKCRYNKVSASKRLTNEEFLDKLVKINNNVLPLEKYYEAKIKILCKCKICGHEWKVTPSHLLRGRGCPKCAIINRSIKRRTNTN